MASVGTIVIGDKKLIAELEKMALKARAERKVHVIVGYTANYALYVHENREMKWKGLPRGAGFTKENGVVYFTGSTGTGKGFYWDPQGKAQSRFLSVPARRYKKDLGIIAGRVYKATFSMTQALLAAGLRLQRESQKMVPVDTGNLKASAFTRIESA